jgi:hypothetical protein
MEEKKDNYIEEYKINIYHHKLLTKYGILMIICLLIVLFFLIVTAINKSFIDQMAEYFLYILLIPLAIMLLLLIPFSYHLYKGGICPNCKKYMDRGLFVYCKICGVKLQENDVLSKKSENSRQHDI